MNRVTRSRTSVLGIADQIVSSATNFLTAFLASYTLAPDSFSAFVVGYAIVTVILAIGRSLVGEPLLTHLSLVPGSTRISTISSALGCALALGAAASIVVAGLWFSGAAPLGSLIWFAPWLGLALVQDACRFVFLAGEHTGRALTLDVVWAAAQGVVLGVAIVQGDLSVGILAAGWGLGALAGIAAFAVFTRGTIVPADPRPWARASRHQSGWLTLTSLLGQCEIYAVLVLAGLFLEPIATAGLRAVQLLMFQPAVTLMAALLFIVTPVVARLAARGQFREIRTVRRLALYGSALLSAAILLVLALRGVLLETFFPRYQEFGDLALPLALQSIACAFCVPFVALLRGFQQARPLFLVQIVSTPLLVGAALTGMVVAGAVGLAWGLAGASAITLIALSATAPRLRRGERSTIRLPSGALL